MSDNNLSWSLYSIWNATLEQSKDRELKPRNRIWASEMGGSYVDRWLKMKGVTPSNPFSARSLRKFEAGNLVEWIVKMVLKRAGILQENQTWLAYQYPNQLEVSGKLDFMAGGNPDWVKAKQEISSLGLPEFFYTATTNIINKLSEEFPNGLKSIVLEIKSCSGFMYDRYDKIGANKSHEMQAFHYLKSKNMQEAHIVYISKDDLRMLELPVFNPSTVEDKYLEDIETMTRWYNGSEQPPLEKKIVFENKFSHNWKISYSSYITKLYEFKDQAEYEDGIKPVVAQWNRVLGRCVKGDKMTDKNLIVIEEIKKSFPFFDNLVQELKDKKIEIVEEENI